jgi:acetylornithine/succinyldiaminopimelate/putrescine aminotransferase
MERLRAMAAARPVIRSVRGRGLLIGIDLAQPAGPIVDACRDRGLLVLTAGERVLRLAPPLIIDDKACDRALEVVDRVLAGVAA